MHGGSGSTAHFSEFRRWHGQRGFWMAHCPSCRRRKGKRRGWAISGIVSLVFVECLVCVHVMSIAIDFFPFPPEQVRMQLAGKAGGGMLTTAQDIIKREGFAGTVRNIRYRTIYVASSLYMRCAFQAEAHPVRPSMSLPRTPSPRPFSPAFSLSQLPLPRFVQRSLCSHRPPNVLHNHALGFLRRDQSFPRPTSGARECLDAVPVRHDGRRLCLLPGLSCGSVPGAHASRREASP